MANCLPDFDMNCLAREKNKQKSLYSSLWAFSTAIFRLFGMIFFFYFFFLANVEISFFLSTTLRFWFYKNDLSYLA